MMDNFLLDNALIHHTTCIVAHMEQLLPEIGHSRESRLYEAMRYAVFNGGKRLRPFLTFVSCSLCGVSQESALRVGAAIEFIHTYSLIHDDLPAMDNDDVRRGMPSCHRRFDEATAILAGDALISLAFEILADEATHANSNVRCQLIAALAHAIGPHGMVGGQMLDIYAQKHSLTMNDMTRLQRMKTGALFSIACEAGAIMGQAANKLHIALRGYAYAIGLAFQMTDDLIDQRANAQCSDALKDMDAHKGSYVTAIGEQAVREQARILRDQAIAHLEVFGERADLLRALAHRIADRYDE